MHEYKAYLKHAGHHSCLQYSASLLNLMQHTANLHKLLSFHILMFIVEKC